MKRILLTAFIFLFSVTLCPGADKKESWLTNAPVAHWIWHKKFSDKQTLFFRKSFDLDKKVKSARVYATCDNHLTLWINGEKVGTSPDWPLPVEKEVTDLLSQGKNQIAIEGKNDGGIAALVFKLVIETADGKKTSIVSDKTWKIAATASKGWQNKDFDESAWKSDDLVANNKLGDGPWAIPNYVGRQGAKPAKNPLNPANITTLPGFVTELVYTVPKEEQGSWVSLATDPHGRLYASDQGDKGLYRIAVSESSDGPKADVEKVAINYPDSDKNISGAHGMVWAFDSLWFHQNGGNLLRLRDTDNNGILDSMEAMPGERGGGEHGNHSVILTEDKTALYINGGNHAPLAAHKRSRVTSWKEDLLLPRMWDARGHARGKLAPGGWVTRFNIETKEQEVICIGFRNEYDIVLNKNGDLFTFDADMEWDMGSPWYRPTRICQVVSGGDYGWRSGSGKWPTYYEDSLPPVIDIGPGSPTGLIAGTESNFPSKYKNALFALDWTFGTIYAIHLTEQGAGYTGKSEPFVNGSPLPVTDAAIGKDGHLYFLMGGRGTQSALFRVRYTGEKIAVKDAILEVGEDMKLNGTSTNLDRLSEFISANPKAGYLIKTTTKSGSGRVRQIVQLLQKANATNMEIEYGYRGENAPKKMRELRRSLEKYHGVENNDAVLKSWPHLSSEDRFIRNAARVAVESQSTHHWADLVYHEKNPQARITGAVALARSGSAEHRAPLLKSLLELDPSSLTEPQFLGLLRGYALTFIRLGKPTDEEREKVIAGLDPHFPNASADLNTELLRVLVYLRSPTAIEKGMDLIVHRGKPEIPDWTELAGRNASYGGTILSFLENHPPSREINYAFMLRNLNKGWTLHQRRQYFQFLNEAAKGAGGASFPGFLANIRAEALASCNDEERAALADLTGENFDPVPDFTITPPKGPGRQWTLTEARNKSRGKGSFESGRNLFFATGCGACHRLGGLGGSVGPDLTSIPNKFDDNYLLEAIIDPSKDISDQYGSSIVKTLDGKTFSGLVVENGDEVSIYPPDPKAKPTVLNHSDIKSIEATPISQMPPGLINTLNPGELRDLISYLMSGGNPKSKRFK